METDKKPLILIVDDTQQNIQVLGSILFSKGYSVSVATSGNEALKSLKRLIPDLVLLDIQMPQMNGFEVCTIIKNQPDTKEIPVIFLTASTETENILKGFEVGAVDFITKPFNSAELLARISTHIELKRSKEKIKDEKVKTEALYIALQNSNIRLKYAYSNIKSSIHYAKRIQENMLPNLCFLKENGIKYFVINKPKDIIGGDLYWVKHINEKIFIAVADCTGHGVPGALLSMLGHNILNEIVNIENIHDSSEILNNLNVRFRSILKQEITLSHDGMDIALCVINTKSRIIEYAGARRSILYYDNNKLTELIPDKLSIGGLENNFSVFSKQIFEFKSGNKIFMFTDGITDQFDNLNLKKITLKRFKNQLSSITMNPIHNIRRDLIDFLKEWKGSNSQTDDILVLGIEIM